jgi:hypothetical protein
MHMSRKWLRLATVPASALIIAVASVAPAQAAAARWRINDIIHGAGSSVLQGVAVTGPTDAWASGVSNGHALVEHYNGHFWHRLAVPRAVSVVTDQTQVLVGATSSANAWVFELMAGHPQHILRWDGHRWHAMTAPAWIFRDTKPALLQQGTVAVFGRSSAWVFSMATRDHPFQAARYLHGRWMRTQLLVAPDSVYSVSADDIWAFGPDRGRHLMAMHWNGHAWRTHAAPSPYGGLGSIAGTGPDDAWLRINSTLAHWNGISWATTPTPANTAPGQPGIVLDGHGGVWMDQLQLAGPAVVGYLLVHYNDGQWSQQRMPSVKGKEVFAGAMCLVPGTTTLWGVGGGVLTSGSTVAGVILRYGT